jgi:hypothetical protein
MFARISFRLPEPLLLPLIPGLLLAVGPFCVNTGHVVLGVVSILLAFLLATVIAVAGTVFLAVTFLAWVVSHERVRACVQE